MADKITVKAEQREGLGKGHSRRLRVAGKIPVVVYGGGTESVSVTANLSDLAAVLRTDTGVNTVFSLDVSGDVNDVIFQDRQIHPVTGRLIHADLRRFARGEKIEMTVPILLEGEPEALKEEGAVLNHALHGLKVLCEPARTPDAIHVDVSNLTADHAIHVSDLKIADGLEVHELPETVVASISIVREADLEPQLEEGAEPGVVGEEGGEDAPSEGGE